MGGVTWPVNSFAEDPVNVRFEPVSNAVIITGDRGIYRWAGGVGPVVNKQGNLQNTQNFSVTIDPSDERTVYAIAQDQGNVQKFSGLPVWNVTTSGNEVGRVLVNPTNSARIYAFAAGAGGGGGDAGPADGIIIRSDDGGATWIRKDTGLATAVAQFPQAYTIQRSFAMDPSNPHRLILGLKQVYETTDDADAWHSISNNADLSAGHFVSAVAVAPSAPGTLYAATDDGKLWATTNNGALWAERDTNLPITQFNRVIDIDIDPVNAQRVFVVTGADRTALDGPHVWMTTNGGAAWTDISANLDPTVWAQTLAVDWRFANPVLYLGTALGVQTSTVIGTSTSWSNFASGLPNVIVEDLQLLPNSNLLVAGTYGRGVYEIRVGMPAVFSIVNGTNAFLVKRDADNVNADVTINGGPAQEVLISQMSTLQIVGGTGNDTLTLDFSNGNPLPAGGISFSGGTGIDALNVIGTTGEDVLTAGPGGVTFSSAAFSNVPINVDNVSSLTFHGGSGGNDSINLASGSWTIDADTPVGTPNVSVTVQPAATATFTTDQHLATLAIAGGLVTMNPAARRLMSLSALNISSGTLDIGGGDLIFASLNGQFAAAAAAAQVLVRQAAGAPVGLTGLNPWTGIGGITSSLVKNDAANGHAAQAAVGVKDNADYVSSGNSGKPVAPGKVLVSYVPYGDANMDNLVDIADLSVWNNNFFVGNHWAQGDFNYDVTVDIADLSIWNNNFFGSVSPAPPIASAPTTEVAPTGSSDVDVGSGDAAPSSVPGEDQSPVSPPPQQSVVPTHRHAAHMRHLAHLSHLARLHQVRRKQAGVEVEQVDLPSAWVVRDLGRGPDRGEHERVFDGR